MRVCVYGLWHLGAVTAACVAEHFDTVAVDPDDRVVEAMGRGIPPISEPGLEELIRCGLGSRRLTVSNDLASSVASADIVWVTFDTPVGDDDIAEVSQVEQGVRALFPHLSPGSIVLVSSQVPVGFTTRMEKEFRADHADPSVGFACSPENLRLGAALEAFRRPERVVLGVSRARDRAVLEPLFVPWSANVLWMSVESAEMTKHALNAFLASSVVFINEIASLCEAVGADAGDVGDGLRSDRRIGPRAYLKPGAAFAGGTLARDLVFLKEMARSRDLRVPLLEGTLESNSNHRDWPRRKLAERLGNLKGKTITVLGLTYKAGTDTLRRSEAIALCRWAADRGATVRAFDPAVSRLPADVVGVTLCSSAADALNGSDVLVLSTGWPEFRDLTANQVAATMKSPTVIDPDRFLMATLGADPRIEYLAVGKPERPR